MLQALSSENMVADFLRQLIVDTGMDNLSMEVQDQLLADLYARLEDRFFATIISTLPEEKLTQFRELLENKSPQEQVEEFLDESLPNASELFAQTMLAFREDYLGVRD